MNYSKNAPAQNHMNVVVRPEIRKGCVWGLQFKFSPEICAKMTEFTTGELPHLEPTSVPLPHLTLFVKSKLLQTELPFSKVAQVLSSASVGAEGGLSSSNSANPFPHASGNIVTINGKSHCATVNVKFTARPRTVFHRHSDVMILRACIKQGEQVLCSDEVELIFRGGTGMLCSSHLHSYFVD